MLRPKKPSEVLIRAKALIGEAEKWTQGHAARCEDGVATSVELGTCFCAMGAVWRACGYFGGGYSPLASKTEEIFERAIGCVVQIWNDVTGRTHGEVMAAFDKAIALAQAEGR